MNGRFSGQVAVITGATGAIGSATAHLLAAEGAVVALLDQQVAAGEALAAALQHQGGQALFVPCDVSSDSAMPAALAQVAQSAGGPTLLVTIAGINLNGTLETLTVADWDRMMAVNVRGVFLAAKYTVPFMKQAGRGAIVNMSSVSAFVGSKDSSPYVTTKGAVLSFSRSIAGELAPYGIRVNAICPGWVNTPFTDQYINAAPDPKALRDFASGQHLLNRMAEPAEVAQGIAWLLSDAASFVTGTELFVDGGFMIRR
ncbi:MAG: SDR family oxidoreductase [Anaerolineae bacterium]|nr:SDR family oxidoreductase [Anaerolineae bacterium]